MLTRRFDYLALMVLGMLFFLPFLGSVHLFDWDEINFAEVAREMMVSGDYLRPQIDFEPFWEKPPLFMWMQVLAMRFFGVNEFAARLPNAVCGVVTLSVIFYIGSRIFDRTFAWLWVLAWLGSLLPHLYFRSGIIDPWFNLFMFSGIIGFIRFRWQFFSCPDCHSFWKKYRWLIYAGGMVGLAMLTKGPVGYLIPLLVFGVYWARLKFRGKGFLKHLTLFTVTAVAVASLWFVTDIVLHGTWFVEHFLLYQIELLTSESAGHGGFLGYHVVVLLLGVFPASAFALPNLWGDHQPEEEVLDAHTLQMCQRSDLTTWMQIIFWVVLILFSIVQTKIVHYSSMCYFPLTFLAALTVWRAYRYQQFFRSTGIALATVGSLMVSIFLALPILALQKSWLAALFSKDPFALANLEAQPEWCWLHFLPAFLLSGGLFIGLYFWKKRNIWRSAEGIFWGGALSTFVAIIFFVKNIEAYSQHAAIEFYKSKQSEDCFVMPVGFKSYANLFYCRKKPVGNDPTVDDFHNLRHGNPGKKIYFVTKINNPGDLPQCPDCRELHRKNGFAFYERTPR